MSSLKQVRTGMDVFDATGQHVGTIKSVKMGDPEAVTAEGQTPGERHSLIKALANAFSGSEAMPDERRERLLRLGYIEVDGKGFGGDFYEAADAVERVSGNAVHLKADRAHP
jgi:hypothetical protein